MWEKNETQRLLGAATHQYAKDFQDGLGAKCTQFLPQAYRCLNGVAFKTVLVSMGVGIDVVQTKEWDKMAVVW